MIRCCFLLLALTSFVYAGVKHQPNVPYTIAGGQVLKLDIFSPSGDLTGKSLPAVIAIHGGGWEKGSRKDFVKIGRYFADRGYVVFTVSYRLVSKRGNRWPAQLDDVQTAVRWVRHHAKKYHVDAQKIAAVGGSAGGHLAAMLGNSDTRKHTDKRLRKYSSRVNAVVSLAGPSDLTKDFSGIKYTGNRTVQDVVDQFLGVRFPKNKKQAQGASPLYQIDAKTVPHMLIHGAADRVVPVDQARRYHKALQKAGIHCKYVEVPRAGHSIKNPITIWLTMSRVRKFLDQQLK